jgi:hypothetical protein
MGLDRQMLLWYSLHGNVEVDGGIHGRDVDVGVHHHHHHRDRKWMRTDV